MHYLPDAALILLIFVVLVAFGWAIADNGRTLLEDSVLPGVALLGGAGWWLWLCGQINVYLAVWSLLFGVVLLLGFVAKNFQRVRDKARLARQSWQNWSGGERALAAYVVLVCALTFVLALMPPGGLDYDSLTYHLAAPRQYLRAGRIVQLPYDHHTYFPLGVEMLYMAGLWLRGPVFAKLFHWLILPMICLGLLMVGSRHLTRRAGLWAAALFASLPVVQAEASTAYIDLGLVAFALLAFGCVWNWLSTRQVQWLAWGGAFCGFALGTKYLGALTFLFLLAWIAGDMMVRRKWQVMPLVRFAGLTILLGGGWYARNWLWTGNPVFPFAFEIFGGRGWTLEMARAYSLDQLKFGFGHTFFDWLWLPWRLAMTPLNFGQPFWPLPSVPQNNGTSGLFETGGFVLQSIVGPPLLALSAPLLAMRRKPALIGFVLWGFAFFWVFWTVTGHYLRYLLPAFALLCVPCGWGATRFLERSSLLKWTTLLLMLAWFVFAPALTLWNARASFSVIAGSQNIEDYLLLNFPGYDAMRWASRQTPPASRFALYGEPRAFYLERDYFWADDGHNNLIDYAAVRSGESLVRALRQQGATHVLWKAGGPFGPPPQIDEAIQSGALELVFESKDYRVYRIASVEMAVRPRIYGRQHKPMSNVFAYSGIRQHFGDGHDTVLGG